MTNVMIMSDARLYELREMRDSIRRQIYAIYAMSYEEDIADAVDEIDRLRFEVDLLRAESATLRRERNDWRDIAESKS